MMHGLYKFLLIHALACLGQNELGSAIIHGKKTPENSMLYMASVQDKRGGKRQHVCGGFLIHKDFVVTAAQCKVNIRDAKVFLGNHNLQMVSKTVKYIEKEYNPPSHMNKNECNDIKLLKLGGKDDWHVKVPEIQLPKSKINIIDKEECTVAGWGRTEAGAAYVNELRAVNVSIINMEDCKKQLPELPANAICAGGYGTDKGFCKGDSGGPLVCNGIAVGVASFNKNGNCNYPNVPNIYTDISKFLPWINTVLKNGC